MFNLLRNSCKQGLSKRTIRLACTVSPRLEMIKAVGAAWNHYWCTLMKSHLFEVQALCLSSNTCVHVCVCVFMCVHEQACIHLSVPVHEHSVFVCTKSSFSLSLSFVKLTPLKTRWREEIGSWGNLISLKCQARSSKPLPAIKYMSSIPSLRIKRFLWQRTRFAIVAWPLCYDKITQQLFPVADIVLATGHQRVEETGYWYRGELGRRLNICSTLFWTNDRDLERILRVLVWFTATVRFKQKSHVQ